MIEGRVSIPCDKNHTGNDIDIYFETEVEMNYIGREGTEPIYRKKIIRVYDLTDECERYGFDLFYQYL